MTMDQHDVCLGTSAKQQGAQVLLTTTNAADADAIVAAVNRASLYQADGLRAFARPVNRAAKPAPVAAEPPPEPEAVPEEPAPEIAAEEPAEKPAGGFGRRKSGGK